MKKILVKAAKYMTPKGVIFEKGKVYELSKEQWDSIPDKDKYYFDDYTDNVKTIEETDDKTKGKNK